MSVGDKKNIQNRRKPKKNQAKNPSAVDGRDTFQTPNYAVDLLVPFIPEWANKVYECAVGQWKLADRLIYHGYSVRGADIRVLDDRTLLRNFILGDVIELPQTAAIVTNPPFSLKRKFYEKCREYNRPFALLIPADYSGWIIKAVMDGAEKIVPTRRIDYITPSGKDSDESHAQFHSLWLTWGFGIGKSETFVELSNEEKKTNV